MLGFHDDRAPADRGDAINAGFGYIV